LNVELSSFEHMSGEKMPVNRVSLIKDTGQLKLIIIGVGVLTALIFSLLWLFTAQSSWKGVMLERRINKGEQVSGQTLVKVWEDIQDLDSSFLTGGHVHLPVLAGQLMVLDESIPLEDRGLALLRAEEAAFAALAREPAHSFTWARLAWFRYMQEGPSAESLSFLRMSIYTAPAKRSLLFWRLRLSALHRQFWDDDFENLVKRQIVFAWRVSPRELSSVVSGTDMEDMVNQIIASSLANGG
jgi:hypothetical protein